MAEDKAKVHNVNVIPNEECVPRHKLLVTDKQFNTTENGIRGLRQECMHESSRRKKCEEYKSMVRDKAEEAEWKYLDVNEHW